MVKLLQGIQLVHDAYKHVSTSDKMVLNSDIILQNRSANIQIENWYPVGKRPTGSKRNSSGLTHKGSKNRFSLNNSPSGLAKMFRTPSDQANMSEPNLALRTVRAKTDSSPTRKTSSQRLSQTLENRLESTKIFHATTSGPDSSFVPHKISCWLFDSVSSRAHKLLLCGSQNRFPCLLAFQ